MLKKKEKKRKEKYNLWMNNNLTTTMTGYFAPPPPPATYILNLTFRLSQAINRTPLKSVEENPQKKSHQKEIRCGKFARYEKMKKIFCV